MLDTVCTRANEKNKSSLAYSQTMCSSDVSWSIYGRLVGGKTFKCIFPRALKRTNLFLHFERKKKNPYERSFISSHCPFKLFNGRAYPSGEQPSAGLKWKASLIFTTNCAISAHRLKPSAPASNGVKPAEKPPRPLLHDSYTYYLVN